MNHNDDDLIAAINDSDDFTTVTDGAQLANLLGMNETAIPDATPRAQALHAQGATMAAILNDDALSAAWASTEKPNRGSCCDECNDERSVTIVRGWLMDEIESRLGDALFDEWLCDTDVQDGFSTPAIDPYLARARKI